MPPPRLPPPPPGWVPQPTPPIRKRTGGILGSLGLVGVLLAQFGSKLAFLIPVLKFGLPILKTGGSMLLFIGYYTLIYGWRFAVGFTLLIFVHECGHLVAAHRFGLPVSAPVFIPLIGAHILLKRQTPNAWVEAVIGIAGPLFGTMAAAVPYFLFVYTGDPFWGALAYSGFFINLFNLAPIGFLDGGRIVTALSPWLWLVGYSVMIALIAWRWQTESSLDSFLRNNFIVLLILGMSVPRLLSLFRPRTESENRYFTIPTSQRWQIGIAYFGLIALLSIGMTASWVAY